MTSLITTATPATRTALAANSRPRRGTAARLTRMARVAYSLVITMVPSTAMANWAIAPPEVDMAAGSQPLIVSALPSA